MVWGVELRDLLTTSTSKPHIFEYKFYLNDIAISMSEEHRNEPHFFSPLLNAKPQTQRRLLSRVYTW